MNRIILSLTAILALAMTSCSHEPRFTVEGTIAGAQDSVLYLIHRSMAGTELLDSAIAGEGGTFSLSGKAPDSPDLYVLAVGRQVKEYINFSVDSTETVSVKAKMPGKRPTTAWTVRTTARKYASWHCSSRGSSGRHWHWRATTA